MTKAFQLFLWQNAPSVNTPVGETLLNKVNVALNEVDSRVANMDTTKANQSDMLTAITSVSFDKNTGIFTFTKKNGATAKIDTLLEKLAINFTYDKTNQRLVITNSNGTIQYVDLKALITELEFLNSDTVLFSVTDGKVTANIVKAVLLVICLNQITLQMCSCMLTVLLSLLIMPKSLRKMQENMLNRQKS